MSLEKCPGCGDLFVKRDGPVHPYMLSSPACWAWYGEVLAWEYSTPNLLATHRLTVDTYAVQHPGTGDRAAIQSVGLHLARLMIQLDSAVTPREANDVMLGLGKSKSSLPFLEPPVSFVSTVADIALDGSIDDHIRAVRAWARATWMSWCEHHQFIRSWAVAALSVR
jgi:Family of unknown function (DUF5946)